MAGVEGPGCIPALGAMPRLVTSTSSVEVLGRLGLQPGQRSGRWLWAMVSVRSKGWLAKSVGARPSEGDELHTSDTKVLPLEGTCSCCVPAYCLRNVFLY